MDLGFILNLDLESVLTDLKLELSKFVQLRTGL